MGLGLVRVNSHYRSFIALLMVLLLMACSQSDSGTIDQGKGRQFTNLTITGPITTGSKGGPFATPVDYTANGYVQEEYFLAGTAQTFALVEGQEQTPDGKWRTQRVGEAVPYQTRLLVYRPRDPELFNGTVIVNWQNVSAGYELGSPRPEHFRGYAWVGVSAQRVGIEGFPGTDIGLKKWDAERYGTLNHPGDTYSYDILSQLGFAVGPNRPRDDIDPMGGLAVRHVVASGASQSALYLRTYINAVHLNDRIFDGYLPYLDLGWTVPFIEPLPASLDPTILREAKLATHVRDDLDVPVLVVNSETEAEGYVKARQENTDKFRFWEVAGTSHVTVPRDIDDGPSGVSGQANGFESPNWLSFLPVYDAATRYMREWIEHGKTPPSYPLIEMQIEEDGNATIVRDEHGNAKGGVRLPELDAPTAQHLGVAIDNTSSPLGFLYGHANPFSKEKLAELYPNAASYIEAYDKAMNAGIAAGYLIPEDALQMRAVSEVWAQRLD